MPAPYASRPAAPALRRGRSILAAALALAGLSCSDGPLGGPGLGAGTVSLRLQPRVAGRVEAPAFAIALVRLGVTRLPDGAVVLDTLVSFGGGVGADGTSLELALPLASTSDRFVLRLAAADAAGDTVFRAVDTASVGRGLTVAAREILLRYAGADTGFARIAVSPGDTTLAPGGALSLAAVGFLPGSASAAPLAHVAWSSSDESVARVSRTGGLVTAVAGGGETWVHARTATGLGDSALVRVRAGLARLALSPDAVSLTVGESRDLAAVGHDAGGTVVTGQLVAWSTSDATIAAVSAHGVVTGIAPGSATITAASGAAAASAAVLVQAAPVARVTLAPAALALTVGQAAPVVAHATGAHGQPLPGRAPSWTTSDPAVATVSASGEVTARGVGTATVTGTVGGASGSATVTVQRPPGHAVVVSPASVTLAHDGTGALAAQVTDAVGQTMADAVVTWQTSDPAIVTVSADGALTATGPGTAIVSATMDELEGSVAVTVLPAPVASVTPSAAAVALTVGDRRQLAATPRSAAGAPLDDRELTWLSGAPGVATVSASGLVTAVGPGEARVTVTSEGRSATVQVTVTPVPVAAVAVAPNDVTLAVGATVQLGATPRDAAGSVLTGRAATWQTSAPAVATVAADGLVTSHAAGQATITATVGGVAAAATVTVAAPLTRSARVTPAAATVAVGEPLQLQAQAYVGVAPVAASFEWASRAGGVATVSAGGLLTPVAPGSAWVVATEPGGARDSARVTVVRRQRLQFDVAGTTLGFGQRWGTGAGTRMVCRESAAPQALTVALASTATDRLQTQSSTTIAAGSLCAAFDATAVGTTTGSVAIVASAPTADGVEWTPDTLAVAVGQPRLRLELPASLTPGAASVSARVETVDQAGMVRLAAESVPLALSTSAAGVARWTTGTATVAEGTSAVTVTLDAAAAGTAALSAADARDGAGRHAADSGTVTVVFAAGDLLVVGWPGGGAFEEDREYRVRIYPRNADGTARASFGADVTFRFDQTAKLEVHEDKYPTQPTGRTTGSKDGRVDSGKTLTATAGAAYLSIIVVIREEERRSTLTITETTGAYRALPTLHGEAFDD